MSDLGVRLSKIEATRAKRIHSLTGLLRYEYYI